MLPWPQAWPCQNLRKVISNTRKVTLKNQIKQNTQFTEMKTVLSISSKVLFSKAYHFHTPASMSYSGMIHKLEYFLIYFFLKLTFLLISRNKISCFNFSSFNSKFTDLSLKFIKLFAINIYLFNTDHVLSW